MNHNKDDGIGNPQTRKHSEEATRLTAIGRSHSPKKSPPKKSPPKKSPPKKHNRAQHNPTQHNRAQQNTIEEVLVRWKSPNAIGMTSVMMRR